MDADMIQNLITSVGFPILCCVVLAWFIFKFYEEYTVETNEREDKLMKFIENEEVQLKELVETNAEFVGILKVYQADIEEIKEDVSDIKEELGKGVSNNE